MVSKEDVVASFNTAAEALGVDEDEIGDLLAFLATLSQEELIFFPIGATNKSIIQFVRSFAARKGAAAALQGATGAGGSTIAPEHQIASHALRKSATWWPACWLTSMAPLLWQVRGDEGSRQQQHGDASAAAASTMLASAGFGPHSASVADTRTTSAGTTSSSTSSPSPSSSSPSASQHLSHTCRQRRSHRAGPQQALGSP